MLATAQARWFQFVFVTAVLITASICLPHGLSGADDRNIDQDPSEHLEKVLDESDQLTPQKRDTAGDDHEEHECQVFVGGGEALFISKFGPTGKSNTDEMGLDPKANSGDILGEDEDKTVSDLISKRKAVTSASRLWTGAVVPWYFDTSRTFQLQASRDKVWNAIYHWQNMTCLRFPYRNTDSQYVLIGTGSGCSSYVGRRSIPQPINLLEGANGGGTCLTRGIIAHEIGHAIGFYHEQSRSDRDNFVEILSANIADGREGNFAKSTTSVAVEYDLESDMHYGLRSFSKNGQPTIRVKTQELSFLAGSRKGLTFYDAKLANLIYNCADGCTNTCYNHGYPFKNPAGQCVCNCPSFLTGDCNTVDTATTDHPYCGGVYELNAANPTVTIQSPNFPNNYDLNKKCVYVFKAPDTAGSGVQLTFTDFDVTGSSQSCDHFVQINANLIGQKGIKYCGSFANSPDGVNTFLDHNSTEMMVIFDTKDTSALPNKGFKFTAKAVGITPGVTTQPPPTTIMPTLTTASPGGPISCTFDDGDLCGWTQATNDDFDWTPHSGPTRSSGTGPADGDQGTPYIYTEVSSPVPNYATASIFSDYFAPGVYCFSFKWHMLGSNSMGNLQLSMVTKTGIETVLFQESGNHDDVWRLSQHTIAASEETKLVIAGTKGTTWKGDIALDSFVMNTQACAQPLLSCDFEDSSLCTFTNDPTADYNWATRTGGTPSSYTGPLSAHEGDVYVYAEATGRYTGDVARLISASSNAYATPFCLTWAYHMYGSGMGSLSVRLVDVNGNMESPIWSKQGNQGDFWNVAKIHVNRADIIQVVFEAQRGTSFRSDIALDLVQIHAGSACS